MKRPVAAAVAAYGAGVLTGRFLHTPPWVLEMSTALLLAGLLAGLLLRRRKREIARPTSFQSFPSFPALLLFALLGWTNCALHTAVKSPADLRVLLGDEPALVTVRGTMAETPRLKIVLRGDQEKWRSAVRVCVHEMQRTGGGFEPATGEVMVTTPGVLVGDFFQGQPVEISGVVARPPLPLAEGLFDFRDYLADRGIFYQVKTESTNDWKLLQPHLRSPPLTDRFLGWAQRTLALGLPREDQSLRLLWAMTLGWRTAFTGDIAEPFLNAGTMHMFAIDGLRVALLSGMMVTLLRVLRVGRAWSGMITIPAIWFYTAATGWQPSAMRASVMMTIVLGGWALKRPTDMVNSLAVAALIILLADPLQMFEASFQLSFFVVLTLALMLTPLNQFLDASVERLVAPDPFIPDDLVPRWRKALVPCLKRIAQFAGLSLAAWIGSLPLAAKYFHLFSPVSTVANVFAVPLGALALMANLGALMCGQWLPWFTEIFNHAAWFFMEAMTWVSVQAARLPGAYFYVREPSWCAIAIYYGVVIAVFCGWFKTSRRQFAGAAVLLVIALGYGWQWQARRHDVTLTVLPLDGGHAVFVDGARTGGGPSLINCGSESAVDFTLKDYLRGQGVNSLGRLTLADANARNCGGSKRLNELLPVAQLWTSGAGFRSAAYREAVAAFEGPGTQAASRHGILTPGETNGGWTILYPPASGGALAKAGDAALVLRGCFNGARILLLSELNRAGQSALLAQTNDLSADVVIAGLPDEGEPLCNALIAAVRPRVIVIADSEFPASRRASPVLKERLGRLAAPVIYTRTSGAVKIMAGPREWRLRTMDTASEIGSAFD
jgi:competence protein ComEC